ncbi:MAG: polyprenyl synthetase family protein [Lachnospiraceae bacterium]|nr:polyprenyl synthetase family protein [Lachnospiraceae bacterium]
MDFKEKLALKTAEAEEIISAYLPAEEGFQKIIFESMNYSVRAGGKRLRPLMMLDVYRMFGGSSKEIEPFMAGMEMMHSASLVHDDLPAMDNDTLRRGKPTTWYKYGEDIAILAGDALMIYAFETASRAAEMTGHPDRVLTAMNIFANKSGIYGMIGGQTVDVELTDKPIDEKHLDFIFRLKTGALIEASMMIGACLAGASAQELAQVEKAAGDIGFAFQIQDDILDIYGSEAELGKPIHSDEKNNKTTYVSLYGLEKAKADVKLRSDRAISIFRSLPGDSSFMEELIESLVSRSF